MERYSLYAWPSYDAEPWPYDAWTTWQTAGCSLDNAAHAVDAFARQSLLDGLQESSVPAYLPRPATDGQYRAAVYHDNDAIYFVLWSKPAEAMPDLADDKQYFAAVLLASADENYIYQFPLSHEGAQPGKRSSNLFGPREQPTSDADSNIPWQGSTTSHDGWRCHAWRIERSRISDVLFGQSLRMGISFMHIASLESATWGTHHAWRCRTDQLINVRLVDKPMQPRWPIVRRVDLEYDAFAEVGSLEINWEHPYRPDESYTRLDLPPRRTMVWNQFVSRIGRHTTTTPMTERSTTSPMKFDEGVQQIEISAPGVPPITLPVEKRSGNRLIAPHLAQWQPASAETVEAALRASASEEPLITRGSKASPHPSDPGRGPAIARTWRGVAVTAMARMTHHLGISNPGLDLLRELADDAIALQREDGTYAGWHLSTTSGGTSDVRWKGGAYDAGCVGEMWIVAYKLLGDEKYLHASQKLVDAYQSYRVEYNNNFASFGLWHLATHYRLTGNTTALEHARYYAQHIGSADLLPCGFQSGHNYYSVYGSITLRGIALLAQVLPENDPLKPILTERATRMANGVFARMRDDGWLDARDRCYIDFTLRLFSPLLIAFLRPGEETVALLDRFLTAQLGIGNSTGNWGPTERIASSDLVHYWAYREKLKVGETIDFTEMI